MFFSTAIPEDPQSRSPAADIEDSDKAQQYLQDRRVIGVRLSSIA